MIFTNLVMATLTEPSIKSDSAPVPQKKKRKKRLLKQGYHKADQNDARRVAAKAFLSSIPLDSQPTFPQSNSQAEGFQPQLHQDAVNTSPFSHSSVLPGRSFSVDVSHTPSREVPLGSPKYSRHRLSPVKYSNSLDSPPELGVFWEPTVAPSDTYSNVCVCHSFWKLPPTMLVDKRLVFTSTKGAPFAIGSVISYRREEERLKLEHPQRTRVRANSISIQIDLDVDLSDNMEVSLGFLFAPLWMTEHPSHHTPEFTPPPSRKPVARRLLSSDNLRRVSEPRPMRSHHWRAGLQGAGYPWAFFRENHVAGHVITQYNPRCLDNHEYFVGNQTHEVSLEGKLVSIIQYTRPSDVKKAMNERFAEVFPYIKLTLSKLRSIKREMYNTAEECELDLEAVAYSYVYFEKLVLMGKINKANRKIIAGVCLLLATKFYTDVRQRDIKSLVNRLADLLHLSTKELILYEFPVLVSLHFSLLVPPYHALPHLHTLRDSELALN